MSAQFSYTHYNSKNEDLDLEIFRKVAAKFLPKNVQDISLSVFESNQSTATLTFPTLDDLAEFIKALAKEANKTALKAD